MWPKLRLSQPLLTPTFWLTAFGTHENLSATFLAAAWGAGAMIPLAWQGKTGTAMPAAASSPPDRQNDQPEQGWGLSGSIEQFNVTGTPLLD